jgi:hypothetical protein
VFDALVELNQRTVNPVDLVEELDRDPFAFDPDRVGRAELAQLDRSPFRREILANPPSIISASTACNRQIARVRAALNW